MEISIYASVNLDLLKRKRSEKEPYGVEDRKNL